MSGGSNKIFIVDGHPLMRGCLSHLISEERDLEFCGEAGSMSQALQKIKSDRPDLVIVDLSLADGSGIDLIEHIKAYDAKIRVLVASMHDESLYAQRVLKVGAQGYVGKDVSTETFLEAIRQVLNDKVYLSKKQRDKILTGQVKSNANSEVPVSIDRLSNRELTVFDLLGQGLSNGVIADKLNLSVKTIEAHQANIKKKLGFNSARDLIRNAALWFIHEDKYRILFENMSQGVFYQRSDGSLVDCNPALLEIFGLNREQFLGRSTTDLSWKVIKEDGSELPSEQHPSIQALRTGKSVLGVIAGVFNQKKKKYVWLSINAIPMFKAGDDEPYEVFVTLHDITDRKELEEKLEFLSSHDSLTKLSNRMELERQLTEEVHRAARYDHPVSIYMLDIDHFKQINDTYGHRAGDIVLQQLAKTLQQSIREEDLAARYGGEEFVIILPETSLFRANGFAKRLFNKIVGLSIPVSDSKRINLSISIGVATFPDHAGSWTALLEAADKAMYQAKKAGRRQIKSMDNLTSELGA
ncbi:MAG: diguanylate cyclase [Gammaproteobacteria bacterium]|nr:diguanylate cyclase [Gammaproteobacteria bacterium]